MSYSILYEPYDGQGRGVRAYIGWNGRYEKDGKNAIFAHCSGDGCISVEIPRRYLYPQEADALCEAIKKLRSDYDSDIAKRRAIWLRDTAGVKEFEGFSVDLSRREVIDALKSETRVHDDRVQVFFRGNWRSLYRTDLKDDVGTFRRNASLEDYQRLAERCYGARLLDDGLGIVDSRSDG